MKDIMNIVVEDIAQVDDTFAVQAAGDNGSVSKNTKLVFQAVAIKSGSLYVGLAVRPFKAFVQLNKHLISDPESPVILGPITGYILL